MKKSFDVALAKQLEKRRRKEEIALEKQYEDATEDYIVAIYFFEQYHSPRCWLTANVANEVYLELKIKSETARLGAVKEQILIRNLGLGWEDANHPWLAVGHTYNLEELLGHLLEVVIPMSSIRDIPLEPPMNVPKMPAIKKLGMISELATDQEKISDDKLVALKENGWDEKRMREERGEGDGWAEKQHLLAPKMNKLKGFRIEMTFENTAQDGSQCLAWYQGTIEKILNAKI